MKNFKKLCRIIFGRTMVVVIFLLIQIAILVSFVNWLNEYYEFFYAASLALSVVSMIYIINDNTNTSFKIAWIIPVLALPVFGTLMYIFVKMELGTTLMNKRLRKLIEETRPFMPQDKEVVRRLEKIDDGEKNFAEYMNSHAFFPVYDNIYTKYFPLGEDKFKAMLEEMEKAEKFIFLEYFIVEEGFMWSTVLDLLKKKVSEGVEVRFMYDGTCTIALLPVSYPKQMEKLGIKCKVFSPIRPILSTVQNNRDHRKILVIDGKTAFTGGINLADEYINHVKRFGHWKDTAIMIKGEAVKSFTLMFLQNWNISESKPEDYSRYISTEFPELNGLNTEGFVIPYSDSPLDRENVGQNVYLDILYRARRYVHIMTPYLILDDEMIAALTYAAKRGVETAIIMPHVPDKMYAYLLARTYYAELISAGVKIYEYTPGFVHAKVFVSDGERAVVGSINLDYRSLFLHFECAVYTYGTPSVAETEADYLETLKKCRLMTLEDCKRLNPIKKIIGGVLRILAPLM